MQSEIDDSIEVKSYCNNNLCSEYKKENRYEIAKPQPQERMLRICSTCVGCLQSVIIVVKL